MGGFRVQGLGILEGSPEKPLNLKAALTVGPCIGFRVQGLGV